MKKIFVFCLVALLCATSVDAQIKMKVKFTDGTEKEKLVRDVESITFDEIDPLKVSDGEMASVTNNSAKLDFTISGYYDEKAVVGIVYSADRNKIDDVDVVDEGDYVETPSKADSISGKITASSMYFELTGLEQNTTYYYKLFVQNEGFDRYYSEIGEFTTAEKPAEPAFVDLGLSVKWATRNIGAPEGEIAHYGGLYVWGDPTGELTLSDNLSGLYDIRNISGLEDYDIATAQWGKDWRLPTKAEMEELSRLKVERVEDYKKSGISGYVLSAKNGNEIFFPSSGYMNSTGKHVEGVYSYYWTAEKSLDKSNVYYANITFDGANIREAGYDNLMFAIRPVFVGEDPAEHEGETEEGKLVKRVNLGFDFDWADRNVGAESEIDYGNYYAWGETETKTDYQVKTYEWIDPNYEDITKVEYISIGEDISKTEYDVAAKKFGGKWRMPTSEEMNSLIGQCKWVWTCKNEVWGYEVTRDGYSGSLFFPAGGYMNGTSKKNVGTALHYWTSTLHGLREDAAYDLQKGDATTAELLHYSRDKGLLIRPVRDRY